MIDLEMLSGLPLQLADDGRLVPTADLAPIDVRSRGFADLRPVLADPASSPEGIAYWMYRGVALPGDAAALAEQHLRYDITIIAPAVLGREYVKTAGHYHPAAPSGVPYGEVYEVLHGRAAYFMQQTDGHGITDAVVVYAGPGDKVNMPPGYGHVTVNIGDTPLVMCNLVAADFASVYGDYAERRGGAYYFVRTPDGLAVEANPRYPVVPGLREASPSLDAELGLGRQPLYTAWQAQPARFRYLVHPELLPHGLRP